MANKRVGTLTVGIFLVILGVVLLSQLITGSNMTHLLINIWPVILVALGLEILYYRYRTGRDDKLRYDLLSMLVLFLVGMSAVSLYALQASGVLDIIKKVPDYTAYNIEIPSEKIPVDGTIDCVVLENNFSTLRVRVTESDAIDIRGNVSLIATSKDEARRILKENKGYSVHREGKNLVIETQQIEPGKWFLHNGIQRHPLEILVPASLPLEITFRSGDVDVSADKVEKDWFINEKNGSLSVTLPKELNAGITADTGQVVGNLSFKEEGSNTSSDTVGGSDGVLTRRFQAQLGQAGPHIYLGNPNGTVSVYSR